MNAARLLKLSNHYHQEAGDGYPLWRLWKCKITDNIFVMSRNEHDIESHTSAATWWPIQNYWVGESFKTRAATSEMITGLSMRDQRAMEVKFVEWKEGQR